MSPIQPLKWEDYMKLHETYETNITQIISWVIIIESGIKCDMCGDPYHKM